MQHSQFSNETLTRYSAHRKRSYTCITTGNCNMNHECSVHCLHRTVLLQMLQPQFRVATVPLLFVVFSSGHFLWHLSNSITQKIGKPDSVWNWHLKFSSIRNQRSAVFISNTSPPIGIKDLSQSSASEKLNFKNRENAFLSITIWYQCSVDHSRMTKWN